MSGDKDEHRRTSEETHNNSPDGANPSNQGAIGANDPNSTAFGPNPYSCGPDAIQGSSLNQAMSAMTLNQWAQLRQAAAMHAATAQQTALAMYKQSLSGYAAYRSRAFSDPPIPDAGISVGEITGWRAWDLPFGGGYLKSLTAPAIWLPGQIMKGDPEHYFFEGVHAFKTKELLEANLSVGSYVLGTVSLWGRVIEHQAGYRAEFAKITSLYSMPFAYRTVFGTKLKRLQRLYGVGDAPPKI